MMNEGQHFGELEIIEQLGQDEMGAVYNARQALHDRVVAIGMYVATALDYAWKNGGLVHSDIRPGNIFISREGGVKVGSLGLTTRLEKPRSPAGDGPPPATALYMSPEQAEGREDIDLRA